MGFDKTAYNKDYNKDKYERVALYVPKGNRDKLKTLAKIEGLSVNDLIKTAIYKAYGVSLF